MYSIGISLKCERNKNKSEFLFFILVVLHLFVGESIIFCFFFSFINENVCFCVHFYIIYFISKKNYII